MDLVTCSVTITRKNLEENEESIGPAYSLSYPLPVKEKIYLLITHDTTVNMIDNIKKKTMHQEKIGVIIGFEFAKNQEREFTVDIRFPAPPTPGIYNYILYIKPSCYRGLDQEIPFTIKVDESNAISEKPIDKEDEEILNNYNGPLDMLQDHSNSESSSDEDEDENDGSDSENDIDKIPDKKKESDDEEEDEKDKKKSKNNKSDSSSSDSDSD